MSSHDFFFALRVSARMFMMPSFRSGIEPLPRLESMLISILDYFELHFVAAPGAGDNPWPGCGS